MHGSVTPGEMTGGGQMSIGVCVGDGLTTVGSGGVGRDAWLPPKWASERAHLGAFMISIV